MSNHIGEVQRVVVCAANRYSDNVEDCVSHYDKRLANIIILGARHFDERMHEQIRAYILAGYQFNPANWEQGFIDQYGVFMTREEALKVATEAGQINVRRWKTNPIHLLFSEDLY